jgi:hypothetical protein
MWCYCATCRKRIMMRGRQCKKCLRYVCYKCQERYHQTKHKATTSEMVRHFHNVAQTSGEVSE